MSIGEQVQVITPEILVQAFELMVVNPDWAVNEASRFSSLNKWKYWQASQSAVVGAVAVAIPVAHIPLIVVDLAFLLHKMAYCCWGVGAIHKCPIESREDFGVILGLYSGVVEEDALAASVTTGMLVLVGGQIVNMCLPAFIGKMAGMGAEVGVQKLTAKMAGKAMLKGVGKAVSATTPLISAISEKVAEKFALKLATKAFVKTALNSVAGFLPIFIGGSAAAGINFYFVNSIANSADTYYRIKKKELNNP